MSRAACIWLVRPAAHCWCPGSSSVAERPRFSSQLCSGWPWDRLAGLPPAVGVVLSGIGHYLASTGLQVMQSGWGWCSAGRCDVGDPGWARDKAKHLLSPSQSVGAGARRQWLRAVDARHVASGGSTAVAMGMPARSREEEEGSLGASVARARRRPPCQSTASVSLCAPGFINKIMRSRFTVHFESPANYLCADWVMAEALTRPFAVGSDLSEDAIPRSWTRHLSRRTGQSRRRSPHQRRNAVRAPSARGLGPGMLPGAASVCLAWILPLEQGSEEL